MMKRRTNRSWMALVLSVMVLHTSLYAGIAQAAMVPTQAVIVETELAYDRDALRQALDRDEVKDQLTALGVDPQLVEQRLASLTADELAELNAKAKDLPAGEGVVGVLLTLFIVFIITDMLCATNIFSFVNCINK